MDSEALDRLIVAHAAYPAALAALCEPLDAELLRSRESETRWSPLEILVHLRDEELEDFRPRAEAASRGLALPGPIDPQGWVTARAYNRQDPATILASLRHERERSSAWLRGLDPLALEGRLEHPSLGSFRAADFIAAWRMHDLLHLRQLATALARLSAVRLAGHRIDYAGTLPQ